MIEYTVYTTATGAVIREGHCQVDDLSLQAGEGETVVEGQYRDDDYYFLDGAPKQRLDSTVTLDKTTVAEMETITVSNLGPNAYVTVDGPVDTEGALEEGTDTLSFDTEGAYTVLIRNYPEKKKTWEVTVNAA